MDEIENNELLDETTAETTTEPHEWSLDDMPDGTPEASAPEPEMFGLKHLGEETMVTREEVIALAQKGRDYDRIRERLVRLESGANPTRSTLVRDVHDFVSTYGSSVRPDTIPAEVWTDVRAGIPLVVAYQRHENRSLRGQLKTHSNRVRATSGVSTAGEYGGDGSIESVWYAD